MAKIKRSENYSKATINITDDTIVETTKDDCKVYSLQDFLKRWDKVENINISISTDDELPEMED